MSVYVDNARVPKRYDRYGFPWRLSHMIADTRAELDDMVFALGLDQRWKQKVGTRKEHFDVTENYRRRAIKAGAKEVSVRELVRLLMDRDLKEYLEGRS